MTYFWEGVLYVVILYFFRGVGLYEPTKTPRIVQITISVMTMPIKQAKLKDFLHKGVKLID